jgi:hypothetical protein
VLYSSINYNQHFPRPPQAKKKNQTVLRPDKKKSQWVVKYSAVYVEFKITFRFAQSSGYCNATLVDSKYTIVQSISRVVECYRGKQTQPKRLDRVSMQGPSLNLVGWGPSRGGKSHSLKAACGNWAFGNERRLTANILLNSYMGRAVTKPDKVNT